MNRAFIAMLSTCCSGDRAIRAESLLPITNSFLDYEEFIFPILLIVKTWKTPNFSDNLNSFTTDETYVCPLRNY